jgi:hypothetical protein
MLFKKFSSCLLPLLLLIVGLWFVPLQIYGPHLSYIPGDLGDARFNNYILEHDYLYLTGKLNSYWDASFMYPFKNVVAFSDNLLGAAPLYAMLRIIGYDRETSFQFWLLVLFCLNFICCYYPLNRWIKNNVMASAGAYIFAFSILLVGNIYNVQTFPRFMVPLLFYWAWRYLDQKSLKYFIYLIIGTVFQFYCGIYLGFLIVYTLFFFCIAHLIVYRDFSLLQGFKTKKTVVSHLLALILGSVLLYPLMRPYIEISHLINPPPYEVVLETVPTLRSYFFTSNASIVWGFLSEHGKIIKFWWCHFLFIGAIPWLAIATVPFIFILKKSTNANKRFLTFLIIGLSLSFIFCLNIDDFSLYQYIYMVPGYASMRSMNRIINTEIMFFILILVFVFNEVKNYSRVLKGVVLCLPVLVIFDNAIDAKEINRYDKKESQNKIEETRLVIQKNYDKKYAAIAYMPDSIKDVNMVVLHLNVMLASQELHIPCVNAYTGHNPGEYNDFANTANKAALMKWCDYTGIHPETIQQIKPIK